MSGLPLKPDEFKKIFTTLREELSRVIVGQEKVVEQLLVAFFAGGHVLLEGVPGLGKTLLAKSFAQTLGLAFNRIQCTPDLMPADILGTQLIVDSGGRKSFEFSKGPVFTQILLADEINRATPKTQSALLEAMEEHQVTVSGTTFSLEEPFFVIATQNPIEMEGTFSLPEAQLDRFIFRIFIDYPSAEDLSLIIRQTTVAETTKARLILPHDRAQSWINKARRLVREVLVARPIEKYIVNLIGSTRPAGNASIAASHEPSKMQASLSKGLMNVNVIKDEHPANRLLRYGASPRGAQAILLGAKVLALINDRVNVSFEDVEEVILPALNHRIILSFEAEADRRTATDILTELTRPIRSTR